MISMAVTFSTFYLQAGQPLPMVIISVAAVLTRGRKEVITVTLPDVWNR